MNVRGVTGEQHPSLTAGCCLQRAVGPRGGEVQRGEGHVRAGHSPQDRLHVLEREDRAMACAAVEVDYASNPGQPLSEHTSRRVLAAHWQHGGVGHFDLYRIAREIGVSAHKLEAALLSDSAAAAVATDQKVCAKALPASTNADLT